MTENGFIEWFSKRFMVENYDVVYKFVILL